jgi:hypothetical protein
MARPLFEAAFGAAAPKAKMKNKLKGPQSLEKAGRLAIHHPL